MQGFVLQRLAYAVFVIFGVSMIVFFLTYLSGDPAVLLSPADASPQQVEAFRKAAGFDRPIYVQYVDYLSKVVRGDFGYSYRQYQPAMPLVLERMPATLELTAVALLLALLVAFPLGIASALRPDGWIDNLARAGALFGQAMPSFWLGIMLILIVSVNLGLLPPSGRSGPESYILPALTLGAYTAAVVTRLLRSSLLEVLSQDYMRTARAKGLAERTALIRHALKNAAIPVVTVVGLQMGPLLGGAVITETVFAYPGMGLLAVNAIRSRDVAVVQSFVILVATMIVLINLFVDLLYRAIDPRIRL